MNKSFYWWLMTKKNVSLIDEIAQFANSAFYDNEFPKQSINFEEISLYLEENGNYLYSMTIFDNAWNQYLNKE